MGRLSRIAACASAVCAALVLLGVAFGSADARRPRVPVTVMTYNIFQGSELSHSLTAPSVSQLGPAVAADYQNVLRSKIPARARALAAEIAANRPAVVGLQEAVLWRTAAPGSSPVQDPGTATHVSFDFVKLINKALAARGVHYRAVAIVNNTDIQATGDFPNGRKMDVRFTDRVALLARSGVRVSNARAQNFTAHDAVPFLGVQLPLKDGWVSADVRVGGRRFRFVSSHLDGFHTSQSDSVRLAEANEIANGPAKTNLPVVFTCDCNTKPGTPPHQALTGAGLRDTWHVLHRNLAGLTCCHRRPPNNPEVSIADPHLRQGIVERLDYIFATRPIALLSEAMLGTNSADRTHTHPRLWPSDHFGLVAHLALP